MLSQAVCPWSGRGTDEARPARRRDRFGRVAALLCALWLAASPAGAVTVPDLLRAETLVTGQDTAARAQGFRDAMEEVLIRLSGNTDIVTTPGLDSYLRNASRYVQQFRYRALPPLDDGEPPAAGGSPSSSGGIPVPTHALEVEFAEAPLMRVLENLGVPVWGRERPQIMLWVAVASGTTRYLVGSDSGEAIARLLSEHAERLGIPVLLPLLDVEDQAAVAIADVRGGFYERLVRAAQRYGVDRVLAVNLSGARGRAWDGQWTLYSDGEITTWRERAADIEQAVARGLDALARKLAGLYAVRRSDRIVELRLRVEDVRELEHYAGISRFLSDLALTRRVRLRSVSAEAVEYSLQVQGSQADLERALALSPRLYARDDALQSLFDQTEQAGLDSEPALPLLVYRYRP